MKLLITGTRVSGARLDAPRWIQAWVKKFGKPDVMVIGCCPTGVDREVYEWAMDKIPMKVFYARWKELGPAAGPIRNKEMVDWCSPGDWCLGFPQIPIQAKSGTMNCVGKAKAHEMFVLATKKISIFKEKK